MCRCTPTMYRHFDKSLPDVFWLDATLALLARCDAILLLPTWHESKGACAEREYAIAQRIAVYNGIEEIA